MDNVDIDKVSFSWVPDDIKPEDRTNLGDFDEGVFDTSVVNMPKSSNADIATISTELTMKGRPLAKVSVVVKLNEADGKYTVRTLGGFRLACASNKYLKNIRSSWVLLYYYATSKSFRKV